MKWFKKIGAMMMMVCLLMTMTMPAHAITSSKSYRTGYSKGDVIKRTYGYKSSGRRRVTYTKKKYVYVSEKVILSKHVKGMTKWVSTEDVKSINQKYSQSIGASGNLEIVKAMKLNLSISADTTTTINFTIKESKGNYARVSLMCDYVQITYDEYTYNSSGAQTSRQTKTLLVPIKDTAVYYVEYSN